ncbi:Tll0287-like domain-containing protein [Natronospira bacteriovora]|uniref:DUF3365 domain-containing protein n=1 Tax=Natronospira bacteriovora TaxID=3069753 RepID=A0ABU0W4X0_9GAMM|nr:DUF3365 domain-containing protein [Natronospira sp. AB-CW4]MDQ2069065.1 DUF3365 domain-containing protein [Natronospira sp. AB-CW4]
MKISRIVLASVLMVPGVVLAGENARDHFRDEARAATGELASELMQALQAAMQEGGPPEAIAVCRDRAPAIKTRLSLERGWRVSRVGTRVRNPLLGMPDAWERRGLAEFQARHADGEAYADMEKVEQVVEDGQRFNRYLRPIPLQGQCLACHGDRDQMSADIRGILDDRYPHDQAHGYQAGELRGAFTIKAPVD